MTETSDNNDIGRKWLAGGGEMGKRMRALDWSKTVLGPVKGWPQSLLSPLSMLLPSKAQIIFFWGPQFVVFYNDAYRPVFGSKHPQMLGMPGRVAWREIWDTGVNLHGLLDGVVRTGEAFSAQDLLFVLERNGFAEETYFDVSYDPVRDESGAVGGVFCIVTETTGRVVGERRLALLKDLAAHNATARTLREACVLAMKTLAGSAKDIAFALAYLDDELQACTPGAEEQLVRAKSEIVKALPMVSSVPGSRAGKLVIGINPMRPFDDQYRSFLDLVATQLATAIANALAYEEEKRRAEALAEIDRAKTAFFSNVSHEFRTPLTLMLGPLEDVLGNVHGPIPPGAAKDLGISHRNALRLLKLVNTMLDFSRIEAGRIQASYEPVDLAALTAELASNFRSACEKAGLRLTVDCPPLAEGELVYVDREMWEKIVLNLVSNAFKFTLDGEIEVSLRQVLSASPSLQNDGTSDGCVELIVRDTGVGIPPEELPRMFERFHRVKNSRGRTHEGTGIGLALVQELVKLHGGAVRVDSVLNEGSAFSVTIPLGTAHLDPQRVGKRSELTSTSIGSSAFVEEAMHWLPDEEESLPVSSMVAEANGEPSPHVKGGRILWADDNADMREYVSRLLSKRFDVHVVADGQAALEAARENQPDLVLSDIMMPRLDGFGLVRELRADPQLREIPIILLSARAGEESRIVGLETGADDYLVKPFSARELVARVETHVKLSQIRRQTDAALRQLNEQLEQRVVERTQDLLQSQQRLRALASELNLAEQRERQRLAGELHDYLGQILALSRIKLSLAKQHPMEPPVAKIVSEVQDATDRALKYTRTLVSQLSPPVLQEFGLAMALPWLAEQMQQRDLIVSLELKTHIPPVPEDQALLVFQSVRELLINCAKHAGVQEAKVILQQMEGALHITVSDEGVGFDLANASSSTTSSHPTAGGFGLFSIRERMLSLGGRFDIHTVPGRGTVATLQLPVTSVLMDSLMPDKSQPSVHGMQGVPRNSTPQHTSGSKLRVLIADDHAMLRQGLCSVLRAQPDFEIIGEASDGHQAVNMARQLKPDIVLMDVTMPGLDGVEATRVIRQEHPTMVVIGLSVHTVGQIEAAMKKAGAAAFVSKEAAVEQLCEAIRTARLSSEYETRR